MIYVTIAVEKATEFEVPESAVTVAVSERNPYDMDGDYQEGLEEGKVIGRSEAAGYVRASESSGAPDSGKSPWQLPKDTTHYAGDWIPHTGTECPVHPLDVVHIWFSNHESSPMLARAWEWDDETLTHYRHAADPDGIPYVNDDGELPEDAEYVATDKGGQVYCYEARPHHDHEEWIEAGIGPILPAPYQYANTTVHWTESLRRVWKD